MVKTGSEWLKWAVGGPKLVVGGQNKLLMVKKVGR